MSSIFGRAVKDRVLVYNPCDHTELPKVITRKNRTLTSEEFDRHLAVLPAQHRLMSPEHAMVAAQLGSSPSMSIR